MSVMKLTDMICSGELNLKRDLFEEIRTKANEKEPRWIKTNAEMKQTKNKQYTLSIKI